MANRHRGINIEPPELLEDYNALGEALYAERNNLAAKTIQAKARCKRARLALAAKAAATYIQTRKRARSPSCAT